MMKLKKLYLNSELSWKHWSWLWVFHLFDDFLQLRIYQVSPLLCRAAMVHHLRDVQLGQQENITTCGRNELCEHIKQMSQSDYVKFWNTGKKVSFKFNILKTLAPHSTLRSLIRFLWSPLTFYPCLLPSYPFLNLRIKMNTLIFAVLSAVLIFSNSCLQVSVKFWSFSFFRYSTSGWPSAFFTKTSS